MEKVAPVEVAIVVVAATSEIMVGLKAEEM